jgi:hypothetical protein
VVLDKKNIKGKNMKQRLKEFIVEVDKYDMGMMKESVYAVNGIHAKVKVQKMYPNSKVGKVIKSKI